MRESQIETHLRRRIERCKGECLKVRVTGRRGYPDRLVIMPGGEVTWVELKAENGTLSEPQKRAIFRLGELSQEVMVLNSIEAINKEFPL